MFASWVKMAAKAAALAIGAGIIIALFVTVQIPAVDFSAAASYINLAYSVAAHYIPGFTVIFPVGVAIIGLDLAILGARIALIAIRWILKINEG